MSDQPSNMGRPERKTGGTPGFSAARGAALVALAVILGIVLLNAIDDGNSGPVGDGGSTPSASTGGTTPDSTPDTSTPTDAPAPEPLPPAEVTVRVLNGSGVSGAAGGLTNVLKAQGYQTLLAGDTAAQTGNIVDAKANRTAECEALAELITDAKVEPMPDPVPGGQDADCIVILGS